METKERYGRFVLQFEDARTSAGSFFRAVQLGPSGYERHVQLFRSELLAPDVAQALADGLKNGLQVQHAQVVRGFEAGRLDKTAFAAYEMFEGRSVGVAYIPDLAGKLAGPRPVSVEIAGDRVTGVLRPLPA